MTPPEQSAYDDEDELAQQPTTIFPVSGGVMSFQELACKQDEHDLAVFEVPLPTQSTIALAETQAEETGTSLLGVNSKIFVDPREHGTWSFINGIWRWEVVLWSPGANFVVPTFGTFQLDEGELRLHDRRGELRARYAPGSENRHGWLAVSPIPGDRVRIELDWPPGPARPPKLAINRFTHGLSDLFASIHGESEESNADVQDRAHAPMGGADDVCHVNTACFSDPHITSVKTGVVFGAYDSNLESFLGLSGALINNVRQDCAPYILTADHAIYSNVVADATMTFIFGYETAECQSDALGSLSVQSTPGMSVRARWSLSDFALLEMDGTVPSDYSAWAMGWDRSENPPANTTCTIGFPNHQPKEVAIDRDPLNILNDPNFWITGVVIIDGEQQVNGYELGGTRSGSSGSPLLNPLFHVIGQLSEGLPGNRCAGEPGVDYFPSPPQDGMASPYIDGENARQFDTFGRLSASWAGGGTTESSLQSWLAPGDADTTQLEGRYCGLNPMIQTGLEVGVVPHDSGVSAPGLRPGETASIFLFIKADREILSNSRYSDLQVRALGPHAEVIPMSWLPSDHLALQKKGMVVKEIAIAVREEASCGSSIALDVALATDLSEVARHARVEVGIGASTQQDHTKSLRMPSSWSGGDGDARWKDIPALFSAGGTRFIGLDRTSEVQLTSPLVERLPPNSVLLFEHRFDTENFADGGVLEFETDGTWHDAGPWIREGGYNSAISGIVKSNISGRGAWAGFSNGWRRVEVSLSSFADQAIRFRWRAATDDSQGEASWEVRNLQLLEERHVCD